MDWFPLTKPDLETFERVKAHYHVAIQSVASVGRIFLSESKAYMLFWTPNLWRLAGKWVGEPGEHTVFRASISFEDFCLYLVNEKIEIIDRYPLEGKSPKKVMLWMEEQVANFGLSFTHLSNDIPFDIPDERFKKKGFEALSPEETRLLGAQLHDAYLVLNEMRSNYKSTSEVMLDPKYFHQVLNILLKDSGDADTSTYVQAGYSPGDQEIQEPYFFVTSWPYTDSPRNIQGISEMAQWHANEWAGLVLPLSSIYDQAHQKDKIRDFLFSSVKSMMDVLMD
jgi:hypothetical protein